MSIVRSLWCLAVLIIILPSDASPQVTREHLTLEQCIAASLNTSRRLVADHEVDQAVARYGQALSARYPSVTGRLMARRLDQDPNFIVPATSFAVPASSIVLPSMALMLPAHAFGQHFPPTDVAVAVPGGSLSIPAQALEVGEQTIRLMDRTLYTGTVSALYAVYTGGLAGARIAQARAGVELARHQRRQTAAEVVFDVTRAYYGVVLAQKLHALAADTHERMRATLDLTESLYKTGSGRVKKTDYLRHSAMVDTLESMVAEFDAQQRTARAVLGVLIGWDGEGLPAVTDTDLPPGAVSRDAASPSPRPLENSPLVGQLQAALAASRAGVVAARAGHLPKVGVFADFMVIGNSYNAGFVTPQNKQVWAVGVGVEVPLFQGFRVTREVEEARARHRTLEQQYRAVREGVTLDVERTTIAMDKALLQRTSAGRAYQSARENRELHVRAYQDDLVETKDMLEAQVVEAVLAGQFHKAQYDVLEAQARLDLVHGAEGHDGR